MPEQPSPQQPSVAVPPSTGGPAERTESQPGRAKYSGAVTIALLVALVALVVIPFLIAPAPPAGEEGFGGTDATASQLVEEQGYTPWASPLINLGSGEIESGLFALQAGLGGLILGIAVGRLSARRRTEQAVAAVRAELAAETENR